jgi:Carboxypeptidase regulatory-like domain
MKSFSPMFAERSRGSIKSRTLYSLAAFSFLFLVMALLATPLVAQEATIVGTVTDPSGSVVPNVTITVTQTSTGQVRSLKTNEAGQYVAPDLNIGTYAVKAEGTGFKATEKKSIVLNVNDRTRIDFVMQVGSVQESVTVEADAVAVQSDSGDVSSVITGEQVTELATNGRSLYNLYALTPGASSIQGMGMIATPVSGDNNVSINGQRAGHNLQLLDGSENLDRGGSQAAVMPSLDAIAEFRSLDSNYSAEYGLTGAATITTVVKSGTKQFHASGWEFDRNDAFDARNYFNPAPNKVAELRLNVYGFNAGGQVPLWKEHPTFFFYNMEWRSIIQGGLLNQTVPLASEYPDAAGAGTGAVIPATLPNGNANIIKAPTGVAGYGANCAPGVAPAPGTPFPNNTIPDCLINGNATALLGAGIFPLPTSGAQFIGGNNSPTNLREEIARIDHQFTGKFSVFGHWVSEQVAQTYGTAQWVPDNVPTVFDTFGNPSYSAVIHSTYVISPTLLNETAFNYDGNRINILPHGVFTAPTGFTFNRLFTGPNVDNRIPSIDLGGSTGTDYTSAWEPWINSANDYQLRDDISWTKGAHQLKFGFSWALYKKVQDYFAITQGNYTFNGSFTGNDFADFLLGDAQSYEEDAVHSSGHWNNVSYAAYVQDNWRVNHRLTLNLGLRWDGAPHTYEANEQSANFYPNLYNPALAATFDSSGNICSSVSNPPCAGGPSPGLGTSPNPILAGLQFYENGIGIGGVNGIPKGLTNTYWPAFGPRIGFAYDLTGQGKTVLRGGFGIMYDRIQGNDMYNGATNTPFDASPTLHNVSLSNPGLQLSNGSTISSADLPVLPVGITGIALNYKPPTSYQYSMGVQQSLGHRTVLGISYVGSEGRHENVYQELNLPPESDLPTLLAAGGTGINQAYGYRGFGAIRMSEDEANSHYNSLQVDLHGNVTNDLQLQFGYTFSRAIDSASGPGSGGDLQPATNPYVGPAYDVGPSIFDRTNIAFVNFVYQIPFLKNNDNHVLRATAGGWAVSGIVTMETGAPINLGVSGNNVSSLFPGGFTGNRPDLSGSIAYPKTVAEWFNPAAFSAPVCATGPDCYGNLSFDAVRGPGRDNWNLSLFKNFVINQERGSRIELRIETFNTWNHTQFQGDANNGGISLNQGASNFGSVTSAFDPREFQFGLKLFF